MQSNVDRKSRIVRAPLAAALLVAVLIGGAVGAYRFANYRPALTGQSHANIGTVMLDVDPATGALRGEASHAYRLTNRSRRPIEILDVRSSCGCTVPSINAKTIGPGEDVEVTATIHLDRPGVRTAEVFVHFDDDVVQTLTLEAMGRSRSPLRTEPHRIMLLPDRTVTVRVIAELWQGGDREPRLSVSAPSGVEANLVNWTLRRPAHPQRQSPTEWGGALHVSVTGDEALPEDAALEITLDGEHTLQVPLITIRVPSE